MFTLQKKSVSLRAFILYFFGQKLYFFKNGLISEKILTKQLVFKGDPRNFYGLNSLVLLGM